ncbi:MAG: hypothetical protein ACYC6M_00070 [Terriglobales bacterium]
MTALQERAFIEPVRLEHLRSSEDARRRAPLVRELLARLGSTHDVMVHPEYFLLSLAPQHEVDAAAVGIIVGHQAFLS